MIIGIAGTIGSGKGTIVEYLKAKGFAHYSSSKLLCDLLDRDGKPKTRDTMSPLATQLQQEYPGGVVEKNYRERFLVDSPEHAVFEALHRQSEANFIHSVGGIVIGIDADLETRYRRAVLRNEGEKDQKSFDDFKKQSYIEDEGGGDMTRDNNIREVLKSANLVLVNNGTREEFLEEVQRALERIA